MGIRIPTLCLALVVGGLVLTPDGLKAQDDLTKSLAKIEKSLWEGWAKHDTEPFQTALAANAVQVGGWGMVSGKEAIITAIAESDCEVAGFSFSDWKARQLTADAAVLTYKAKQDAMCGGEKVPETLLVTAMYVREGDAWMSASYQETPLMEEEE